MPNLAEHRPRVIAASGGVAANTLLRERIRSLGEELGVEVVLPPVALTTDNAAMIGAAAYHRYLAGERGDRSLDARPSYKLAV